MTLKNAINLKNVILIAQLSTVNIFSATNIPSLVDVQEPSLVRPTKTTNKYLEEFEIQYQLHLKEIQRLEGWNSVKKQGIGIGLSAVLFLPVGLMYAGAAHSKGVLNAGDNYIRQRPTLFSEMFPEENENRNEALAIITRNTEQYIKDKQDYPIPGSHTVLSMFR